VSQKAGVVFRFFVLTLRFLATLSLTTRDLAKGMRTLAAENPTMTRGAVASSLKATERVTFQLWGRKQITDFEVGRIWGI